MKALAKDPGDRFQSMDELRAALVSPGELEPTAPNPAVSAVRAAAPWRGWKIPTVVAALAAVASVAFATLPASRRHASSPVASVAQPWPKTVAFRFESDPAGAHVFDAQGNDLGRTPLEVPLPHGKAVRDYVLRLAGHRTTSLRAVPDANRTLHVLLDRLGAPSTPGGAAQHPVRRHLKKGGLSLEADDLAKPSF